MLEAMLTDSSIWILAFVRIILLFKEIMCSEMELGMGIEPIYNSSAGCRLNDSATPALTNKLLAETNKNIIG
jgi:hypothetical protein